MRACCEEPLGQRQFTWIAETAEVGPAPLFEVNSAIARRMTLGRVVEEL